MLAKIVDDNTKLCIVAIGTDKKYYESQGFVEIDVEQAYNGNYYVKGYVPSEPEPTKEEKLAALDAQYDSDKATLVAQYADALMHDDTDTANAIKSEMVALDEQYDIDYEAIVSEDEEE